MINVMSSTSDIDKSEPYCNRAKLDTGTQCNHKCWFCYYKGRLGEVTPIDVIKSRVDYLVECGIKSVDLSGGESSIHDDWFEILYYCKSKGLTISTVSNGTMFVDEEFLRKSMDHGLQEILFSLHGTETYHNLMVGVPNGFRDITQAIRNANELGVMVRINCVVGHLNYDHLKDEYVDLIHSFDCLEVNLLTLNFWGNTDIGEDDIVDYGKVSVELVSVIDRLRVPYVNVRYIPYCYMVGYEKHVCNTYQHIYDTYDWNMAVYNGKLNPDEYKGNEIQCLYDAAKKDRINGYHKTKECLKCKYFYICDGLEKNIKSQSVYPVDGSKIRDVNHYRKGFYADQRIDTNT